MEESNELILSFLSGSSDDLGNAARFASASFPALLPVDWQVTGARHALESAQRMVEDGRSPALRDRERVARDAPPGLREHVSFARSAIRRREEVLLDGPRGPLLRNRE